MSIWKVPRVTTAQRLTITPEESEVLYDTTSKTYWGGDGITVGGVPLTTLESTESRLQKSYRTSLAYNSSSTLSIGSPLPANARVNRIVLNVTSAFNTGTVSFGVAGSIAELGLTTESNLLETGLYVIECYKNYSAGETVIATYSGGASAGSALIEVFYTIV